MQYSFTLTGLLVLSTPVLSISYPSLDLSSLWTRSAEHALEARATCPVVWQQIGKDLKKLFVTNLQCNDDARAAIRASFHDCFPSGGCDGSLAIPSEQARPENTPMIPYLGKVTAMAAQYKVTNADMIQFAGAVALASCPMGPRVKAMIGRKDATQPAPQFQLPRPDIGGDDAVAAFKARGFSAQELVALIGAHTVSRQFGDATKSGVAQDSTPGIWDILYYAQTLLKLAPLSFISDINISKQKDSQQYFRQYSVDRNAWMSTFVPAMNKLSTLENNVATMADCSMYIP